MRRLTAIAAVLCLLASPWHAAHAQAIAPIPLELNKLEPLPAGAAGPGCRVYMVVSNPDADPIAQLRLDLMLFGTDGVITKRIALDLAPLAARKTAVRLFDLADAPCDGIGKILVSDVLACQTGKPPAADTPPGVCLDRLQVSARGKVELTK
jgi:hypothetical protein